jgi:probable HAF family extracellular repeat protein
MRPRSAGRVGTAAASALSLATFGIAAHAAAAPAPAAPAYVAIAVGTFGGPNAALDGPAVQITRQGAVLGTADTTVPDEDFPNGNPFIGADPLITHAYEWRDGRLADLGALPGNNSSGVFEVNGAGVGAGISETGTIDPTTGYPAEHAVLFAGGTVTDLGTLAGGTESQALAINDRGQVAGFANNDVPDPTPIDGLPFATQARAFLWEDGVMRDLGTLGGPDATVATLNERGEVAGISYTDDTPNPTTGVPTTHPYLWANGQMHDLGTLGGSWSNAAWLNAGGDVVGASTLAGDDTIHPFLWDGQQLRDLGTVGGTFGRALHVSDTGAVVGFSTPPGDSTVHAFLWTHGVMSDLTGNDDTQCTVAEWVNNHDQAVGETCNISAALLWSGGKQYDLNDLIAPSDVQLFEAPFIDDRAEITTLGALPDGSVHVFLLRPTGAPLSSSPASQTNVHPHTTSGCVTGTGMLPTRLAGRIAKTVPLFPCTE